MKLIYIFDSRIISKKTGSSIHVVELLKALEHKGLDLTILTSYETKELNLKDLKETINNQSSIKRLSVFKKYSKKYRALLESKIGFSQAIKLLETIVRFKIFWRNKGAYNFFLNKISHIKPDIVYQRHEVFTTSGLKVVKRLKIPVILEVNAPAFYEEDLYLKSIFKRDEIKAFNLADAIIVVSNSVKDILMKIGIKEEKTYVIPNAVDTITFSPQVRGDYLRAKYGLNEKIVIGFVGSFKPWHGIDIFLSIADNLKKSIRNVHIMLIGDNTKLSEDWKRFSLERADWITLTGVIPHHEVPNYISIMDIAVMPNSNTYGSPIKIFEYMAMEKAVVAPRLGPVEEIIKDGVNGLLVTPADKNELLEKIILLAENPELRITLGQQAISTVLKDHTWEKNALKIIDIIKRLQ